MPVARKQSAPPVSSNSVFLYDLIRYVRKGELVPARFNRPYAWQQADVEAMCESILSGLPIGAFVIWEPDAKTDMSRYGRGRLGPIPAATGKPAGMLLDGQNRLASLAWLMTPPGEGEAVAANAFGPERDLWLSKQTMVMDLPTQTLRFVPIEEANIGPRMPLWIALNPDHKVGLLFEYIWERQKGDWKDMSQEQLDDLIRWYDEIGSTFRNARIVVSTIQRASEQQALDTFRKLCKVGVPISDEDFRNAMEWTPPEDPAPTDSDVDAMRF